MLKPSPRNDELELLVVSREVFATRYTSGALVVTMLIRGVAGAPHYLVYINRTWVDGLHDFWRFFINYRVKSQAARIFADARARLEGTPDGNR